jgi:hypothetical protein
MTYRTAVGNGPGGRPGGTNIFLEFRGKGQMYFVASGINYSGSPGVYVNNQNGARTNVSISAPNLQTAINNAKTMAQLQQVFNANGLSVLYNFLSGAYP